jgi:hypothetical protein
MLPSINEIEHQLLPRFPQTREVGSWHTWVHLVSSWAGEPPRSILARCFAGFFAIFSSTVTMPSRHALQMRITRKSKMYFHTEHAEEREPLLLCNTERSTMQRLVFPFTKGLRNGGEAFVGLSHRSASSKAGRSWVWGSFDFQTQLNSSKLTKTQKSHTQLI